MVRPKIVDYGSAGIKPNIQSHYVASTSLPSAGTGSSQHLISHASHVGLPMSTVQSSLPLYSPSGSSGSWISSLPPTTNGTPGLRSQCISKDSMGLQLGFKPSTNIVFNPHQACQMALSMPAMLQSMPYPAISAFLPSGASNLPATKLADFPPPFLPRFSNGTLNQNSSILPILSTAIASDSTRALMSDKASTPALPETFTTSLPLASSFATLLDKSAITPAVS
ncbi:unnamed protein product [Ilex paraguariensis]|uniref:Uncharacterized protein n=1 Tax=Ilex paraguariensis TaxID=185542 RepID=A0ABC8TNF8_9AQUA